MHVSGAVRLALPVVRDDDLLVHLVRGQLFGALQANVGGTLLGLMAVAAVPWLAVSAGGAGGGVGRRTPALRLGWPQESY